MEEKLLQPRIQDDRTLSLSQINQNSDKSLIERLLEIQTFSTTKLRSFKWAQRLTCLSVVQALQQTHNGPSKRSLQEVTINIFKKSFPFAAVSYCCKASEGESPISGSYQIHRSSSKSVKDSVVRDVVLDRVIHFTLHHRLKGFWIDEECLDKHNPEKKQEAINGIDIVYRKCCRSVGLLTNALSSKQDAQLLDDFLQARYVETHPTRRLVKLAVDVGIRQIRRLMDVLGLIFSDQWWQRCWIFQEGYCGKKMMLLMPYAASDAEHWQFRKIEYLHGDVQFGLRSFQVQTSLFCLAIYQDYRRASHLLWPQCQEFLKKARRYDVLHKYHGGELGAIRNTPMSASIIADICPRDLENKADIPAIVANCCDYTRRIQLPPPHVDQFSLSLVLLALFLPNGDMLVLAHAVDPELSQTVCQILASSSFGQSVVPVGTKKLTFLKRRRWPRVELCLNGLKTWGHVWKVDLCITIKHRLSGVHFDCCSSTQTLKPSERARLRQLAMSLMQTHPNLSCSINRYLEEDADSVRPRTQKMNMMWTMAKKVCQAIEEGRPLLLGKPSDMDTYHAIFVSPRRNLERQIHVVTSWEAGRQIQKPTKLRAVEKYVSLEVDLITGGIDDGEQWKPIGWVNGLCFFNGIPQQSVMLPWPDFLRDRREAVRW